VNRNAALQCLRTLVAQSPDSLAVLNDELVTFLISFIADHIAQDTEADGIVVNGGDGDDDDGNEGNDDINGQKADLDDEEDGGVTAAKKPAKGSPKPKSSPKPVRHGARCGEHTKALARAIKLLARYVSRPTVDLEAQTASFKLLSEQFSSLSKLTTYVCCVSLSLCGD